MALSTTYVLINPKFMPPVEIVSQSTNFPVGSPHYVHSLNIFALVLQLGTSASYSLQNRWSLFSSDCLIHNPKGILHFFHLHILSIINLLGKKIHSDVCPCVYLKSIHFLHLQSHCSGLNHYQFQPGLSR